MKLPKSQNYWKRSKKIVQCYGKLNFVANSNRIKVVSDLFFNLFILLNNIVAKLNFILFRFQFCFHLQSILGMFIQLLNPEAALLQYPLRVNQSASYLKVILKF